MHIESDGGKRFEYGTTTSEEMYQLELLREAGFIKGSSHSTAFSVDRLTWDGHDYLNSVPNRYYAFPIQYQLVKR